MKAIVFKKYGDPNVLQMAEVEKPLPKSDEILVKIYATSVTAEDPKMRSFDHPPLLKVPVGLMFGFRKPKQPVLGIEFSGVVEAIGDKVKSYQINDKVFGYTGLSFGAYAEYKCLPESALMHLKPQNLPFTEAATMVNGPLSALAYLKKKGKIEKGHQVLIYGASGSVGTAAVQLAKYFGAHVTGVCSTKNLALVKSIGANEVIDYTRENFADTEKRYDIVFDTVGKTSMKECMSLLTPKGKYLLTEFGLRHMLAAIYTSLFRRKKVVIASSNFYWKKDNLIFLKQLAEQGHYKPVVDRCFELADIAEAHTYVASGRKVGNVAVVVCGDEHEGRVGSLMKAVAHI
ncbi:NAD(P)-dependent alcohol dehydrogenase [Imperialibacter roseus]|uniref:NAD(P)-dependent alcohol dehydrogenase n=1 Tax=Imperialibacter roseus TaxID=1324217 RepID=A0ABZ0IYM7_9BACT|nr:NAD(P)-dependent alcohol dehydrogenase [Imperialibacter roseus]WOK08781.1 NAD(P)-dependent alcohol dehydrogenase [Imperialibacter roseus]